MTSILLHLTLFSILLASRFTSISCLISPAAINHNHTQHHETNDPVRNTSRPNSDSYIQSLKSQIQGSGSCSKTRICFALDGSGSISPSEYSLQIKFAETIASIISVNPSAQFAAIQYGLRNVEISPLTDDLQFFRTSLNSSKPSHASRTFIAAGIGGCAVELRGKSTSINTDLESNGTHHSMSTKNGLERSDKKIVLLGDGRGNFGISPVQVASKIEEEIGADLFAIGIGFPDVSELKEIVGEAYKVGILGRYRDLGMEKIVSDVVSFACGTRNE